MRFLDYKKIKTNEKNLQLNKIDVKFDEKLNSELRMRFTCKKAGKSHISVEKWAKIQENQGKVYVTIPQPLNADLGWL